MVAVQFFSLLSLIFCTVDAKAEVNLSPPTNWQRQFRIPQGVLQQYISPVANNGFDANLDDCEELLKILGSTQKTLQGK